MAQTYRGVFCCLGKHSGIMVPRIPNHFAMAHYEIEIKSLLGSQAAAEALKEKMRAESGTLTPISENKQLNHYFEGGDVAALFENTKHLFSMEQQVKFEKIVTLGKDFSVRTREKDGGVLLVVKASVDEGTSANTVSRLEFEELVPASLDALDRLVESAGYQYQAKWSREREEYTYRGLNVCIDRNAGYGYLAEFEKVIDAEDQIAATRAEIEAIMAELGVVELPQDRLARMFDFYNSNWADYYGTDKTFILE